MKSLLPPELQAAWNVRDTVSRRERFRELAFAGYRIPRCGLFRDMARLGVPLVVYRDEFAHCGEGKDLVRPGDWTVYDPTSFCSEYVGDPDWRPARSRRTLIVGYYEVHLDYRADGGWQSNVGGEFDVYAGPMQWPGLRSADLLPYPMYAVDRVREELEGSFEVAVDLNVCPGVPLEVVNAVGRDALAESVAKFCRDRGLIA